MFKKLVFAVAIALCLVLLDACVPEIQSSHAPTAAPTAAVSSSPTKEPQNFIKQGEVYRVLIWNNSAENDCILNDESARGDIAKKNWEDYQDQHGITITYIASPATWWEDVRSSAAAQDCLTDIFNCGGPFTLPLLYGHDGNPGSIVYAMDDYPTAGDFSDPEYWDQSAQKNAGTFGGKLYFPVRHEVGFGLAAFCQVTIFNTELLQTGGYTKEEMYRLSESGEWTFDKLREVAIGCTEPDSGYYGLNLGYEVGSLLALIPANGGSIIDFVDNTPVMATQNAKSMEAINFLVGLAKDDKCVNMHDPFASIPDHQPFLSKDAAMMITYANRTNEIYKRKGLDYGVIMPPKGNNESDYISDVNWFVPWAVMRPTENPEGCIQILSQYFKNDIAKSSSESNDLFEAEARIYVKDEGSLKTLKDVQEKAQTSVFFSYARLMVQGDSLIRTLFNPLTGWVNGEGNPEEYYDSIENAVNAVLKESIGG